MGKGQEVHLVDLTGTFSDRRGPFAPATKREYYRMLGAIIPTEKYGQLFLKFYGPKDLVKENEKAFGKMIDGLILREYDPKNSPQRTELEKLRKEINLIDDELINILSSRMEVARNIGKYKKANNITILQSDRWKKVQDKYKHLANVHDLSEEFIIRFIKAVHDESINQQEKIFEGE